MDTKTIQIGYDKKLKKPILKEITYDFFADNVGWEWYFRYKGNTIEIAWHEQKGEVVYLLITNGYDEDATHQFFDSPEELLEKGLVEGKTIKDIWTELET